MTQKNFLGFQFRYRVEREWIRRRLLGQNSIHSSVNRAGGHEDNPPVKIVREPADRLYVDFPGKARVVRASTVTDQCCQPYDHLGPVEMWPERSMVADIAI